jgi:hypothetical protein
MQQEDIWDINAEVSFGTHVTVRLWSQDAFGDGDDDAFLGDVLIRAEAATHARGVFDACEAAYELTYDVHMSWREPT